MYKYDLTIINSNNNVIYFGDASGFDMNQFKNSEISIIEFKKIDLSNNKIMNISVFYDINKFQKVENKLISEVKSYDYSDARLLVGRTSKQILNMSNSLFGMFNKKCNTFKNK